MKKIKDYEHTYDARWNRIEGTEKHRVLSL
jgi:hypothetical protein